MFDTLPQVAEPVYRWQRIGHRVATWLRLPGTRCERCRKPEPCTAELRCGCIERLCLPCVAVAEAGR